MYAPGLTKKDLAEMAAAGFTLDDYSEEVVEVWPENIEAYSAFNAMGTQWRTGMAGATGLDYAAIPVILRLQGVPRVEWGQLFEDLRAMENSALAAMNDRDE